MKRSLTVLSLVLVGLAIVSGQQGGSVFLFDVQPLLRHEKTEFDKIAADFQIYHVGDASRISQADNPGLTGIRIGPYSFYAKPKGFAGPYTHELRIETRIVYLNKAGKKVAVEKAADVREDVTAITIRPLPSTEYFTPAPD